MRAPRLRWLATDVSDWLLLPATTRRLRARSPRCWPTRRKRRRARARPRRRRGNSAQPRSRTAFGRAIAAWLTPRPESGEALGPVLERSQREQLASDVLAAQVAIDQRADRLRGEPEL